VQCKLKTLVLLCCIGLLLNSLSAQSADPRNSGRFYIESYGLLDPSDLRVKEANGVFDRLLKVADRPIDQRPLLRIIDSDGKPWAIALPDGSIILSRGALEICYRNVDKATGDARLALILGHELAHLTQNDFWHRDMHLILSERPKGTAEELRHTIAEFAGVTGRSDPSRWQEQVRQRELIADDRGYLFASLAGFKTSQLLYRGADNQDFFSYWVKQTRVGVDKLHVPPKERVALLNARFVAINKKVELFDYGVRLLALGRYDDAITLLLAFRKSYPAAAVTSNLGFAYLRKAVNAMRVEEASQFWLPGIVDTVNPLVNTRSLGNPTSAKVKKNLRSAVNYLVRATRFNSTHIASRVNLATAYWYLGEYHKARAAIEDAKKLDATDPDILGLRALILLNQEKDIDMWPVSAQIMNKLAAAKSSNPGARYNLAQLLEIRGRKNQALAHWNELAADLDQLPEIYRQRVCEVVAEKQCASKPFANSGKKLTNRYLDSKLNLEKIVVATPRHWSDRELQINDMDIKITQDRKGLQIFSIDGHPELIVRTVNRPVELSKFESLSGPPKVVWRSATGEFRLYNNEIAARLVNDRIQEIWWGHQNN